MNGMPVGELAAEAARRIDEPWPAGESYRQVVARIRSFLSDVGAKYEEKRIVVIGHSATRWSFDHLINGIALEDLVNAPFNWQPGWEYRVDRRGAASRSRD